MFVRPTSAFDANHRPARSTDAEAIFPLLQQFAASSAPERAAFDRHYPRLLSADHADLIVAQAAGRVVGYALAFRLLTLYANGIVVEVQELMVAPEHRRQGIGRRLVEGIVERASAAGSVEVMVPTRRARAFYLPLGFVETAAYLKRPLA